MFPNALEGIRVLDLSRVLAGPYCTMLLGDYGADVIKIEIPGRGDDTRQWGPPWFGTESAYYLSVNRNKRSLTLNLKHSEGAEIIRRLASQSDILVENFMVGMLAKFDLDYPNLRKLNPGLIYCSLTGYGQYGIEADRAGYDFITQAEGGIMSITGPVDGEPYKVGVAIVDITAGLFALNAILAALYHREQSGEGQYIDVALFDSQLAWLTNVGENYLISGQDPLRYGNAHPNIVPYQVFASADGRFAIGVGNDAQYRKLCELAECLELWEDPRFQTNPGRVEHRRELVSRLQQAFLTRTNLEWLKLFRAAEIPSGPINTVSQALNHPQARAREMVQEIPHPLGDKVKLVGPVAKLSETPARIHRPPPLVGEHNTEILAELLGYTVEDITRLRGEGVI